METFHGSCLCQKVKFEIQGEVLGFYLCHCSRCRKVTGSAHASNFFVKASSAQWLQGEEFRSRYEVPGTRFVRSFCSQCSGALPTIKGDDKVLIPAGSLDSEFTVKPIAHIHCASRASWDDGFADVVEMPGLPE